MPVPPPPTPILGSSSDTFADSRTHGYKGSSRYVRLARVTPNGTAAIAKSEDGFRCAVAGKESLRVVRISGPSAGHNTEHKSATGPGGHRIDASRNFWDNSGLKIDSTSTDVAWGYGLYNNKILTSARNGELIMWDLNKNGAKYERRSKDHIRSINKLSVSHVAHYYCITGSADGDMRIWDLRDLTKSLMRVRHPTSIRSLVFSPSVWQPLQAIVGLDNGSIHRWDLKMGQRGGLDRLAVAHSAPVTTLDWCSSTASGSGGASPVNQQDPSIGGLGWLVSGGLDRCVKVWDLTAPAASSRIPNKPTYVLHPSFPVRRVAWRPGYECELAIVSNDEILVPSSLDVPLSNPTGATQGLISRVGSGLGLDTMLKGFNPDGTNKDKYTEPLGEPLRSPNGNGDALEIWDVRREWVAKWSVSRGSAEGGIADIAFSDSHALWAQSSSGTFSQLDLREATKPIASINRVAATWDVTGSLTFVANKPSRWDPPYDDIQPPERSSDAQKPMIKGLGDPPVKLKSQAFGTFITGDAIEDLETITYLARNYRFEGPSKKELCETNAEIALQAGCVRASQTWKLMAANFSEYLPQPPKAIPRSPSRPRKPPPPGLFLGAPNNDLTNKWSPGLRTVPMNLRSRSPSSSSNLSSPRHLPVGLPVTPNRTMFPRRSSIDGGGTSGSKLGTAPRRSSVAGLPLSSSSPGDRALSSPRHVGEGALDDSSSSSDGLDDTVAADEEPLPSPASFRKQLTAPSPLSQQWSEDEDDVAKVVDNDASPSPRSTDTDSDGSSTSRREAKPRPSRRATTRIKSRSHSSTIASLAAPPGLVHQDSRSSIRTVTAAETALKEAGKEKHAGKHRRQKSRPFVQELGSESDEDGVVVVEPEPPSPNHLSHRRIEVIRAEERRFRDMAWAVVRQALDEYTDEGDVQISAMICVLAQEELKLPTTRVIRTLEAYLERLMRLRLYTCAASIGKYSNIEALRNQSLVETVIYTTCARCHKPTMRPALPPQSSSTPSRGAFAYCLGCGKTTVSCSICHLPVRALLFQCAICKHGGHQACYRQYYMEHTMHELQLPSSFVPSSSTEDRGRPLSRNVSAAPSLEDDDDAVSVTSTRSSVLNTSPSRTERSTTSQKIKGHPCATGCGHHCWAANMVLDPPEGSFVQT